MQVDSANPLNPSNEPNEEASLSFLIVDDHALMRTALRDWVRNTFPHSQFREAATGAEALALARTAAPQFILMDIGIPDLSGIEATRQIKTIAPETRLVILSIHDDGAYRSDATAAGASAYVPKRAIPEELVPTLRRLLDDPTDGESAAGESPIDGETVSPHCSWLET